jgi:hypothetical protein
MVEVNEAGKIINSGDPQKARDVFKLLDQESEKRRKLEISLAKVQTELESYIKVYGRLGEDIRVEGAKKMDEMNETLDVEEPEAPAEEPIVEAEAPVVDESPVEEESSLGEESNLFMDYSKKMLIDYLESKDQEVTKAEKKSKSLKLKEELRLRAVQISEGN